MTPRRVPGTPPEQPMRRQGRQGRPKRRQEHPRRDLGRHRRNTLEKTNRSATQKGDGRTNGGTRQSYGRNTKETREGHAGNPALSAERGRGARPRSYTRVSGDAVKLHACTWEGCLDARAAVVAPALGLLLCLFLLCSLFLPVSSLLFRLLQCLQLSPCTRFPFYDSQVYFSTQHRSQEALESLLALSWVVFGVSWRLSASLEPPRRLRRRFCSDFGGILGPFGT